MEIIFITISMIVLIIVLLAAIIGITLYDIRAIQLDKQFRAHPYAKKFRRRPLISIIIGDEPTASCLKGIRASNYRKVEIVKAIESAKGEYILEIDNDMILVRTAISDAVRRLNANPSFKSVQLDTMLEPAQTLRQFFRVYYQIVSTPFIFSRAGLNIFLTRSPRPTLVRKKARVATRLSSAYSAFCWLGRLVNMLALIYLTYIAVVLTQPEFLLGYLLGFSLWLVWAIGSNRQLSLMRKIAYILLAPSTFGYFAVRCLFAPLWPKQYSLVVRRLQPSR